MAVTFDLPGALRRAAADLRRTAVAADPATRVRATPDWTVADVVAHVAIECNRYRRELEGDSDWSASGGDIAETNRRALAAEPERSVPLNLDCIERDVNRYAELLAARDPDTPSHHLDGGLLLAPRHAAGVLLGELTIHHRDVARASGRRVELRSDDVLAIIDGTVHTMPGMVDAAAARGRSATVELRIRGVRTYTVRLDDGRPSIEDGSAQRRDAVISTRPLGFVLLSYGRRGQAASILRGDVIAWGRRVDRAFLLDRVFPTP